MSIMKLTDPHEIAVWQVKTLIAEGYWPASLSTNDWIARLAYVKHANRSQDPDKAHILVEDPQLEMFTSYDRVYNVVDNDNVTRAVALGNFRLPEIDALTKQKRKGIEKDEAEENRWLVAVDMVKPLLVANEEWTWRDAVEHLQMIGTLRSA